MIRECNVRKELEISLELEVNVDAFEWQRVVYVDLLFGGVTEVFDHRINGLREKLPTKVCHNL